ncbi:hypothetical protein [Desulfosporosinus shakirovi]|uniref:hypothetical protein n=1 Tax=Desulfosporosinus shakirovi TaxID=2885154 RepID=UPI001E5D2D89|nr:hypothetical protein [Desulfosporosinus sp. SRJS8]MCB8818023.1 hypothetical protein [Desulfosporosinus sp. SRJS8]
MANQLEKLRKENNIYHRFYGSVDSSTVNKSVYGKNCFMVHKLSVSHPVPGNCLCVDKNVGRPTCKQYS